MHPQLSGIEDYLKALMGGVMVLDSRPVFILALCARISA